ncbi:uncharacterized protein LOC142538716 [Primulina tabacum]|uniref:uncharacterized protein LOC142538716 n=1 Tax=Primulina tabacum TaxID=48773 RepID=UPI003F59269D
MVFTLLMLKVVAAPYTCDAVFSGLAAFWDATRCFMSSPLYIYLGINFMIVLIAVSSTFHGQENDHRDLNIKINLVDDLDDAGILESPPPSPPRAPPQNIASTTPPPPPQNITTKRKCTKLINTVKKETFSDGGLGSDVHGVEKPLNSLDSVPPDSVYSIMEGNQVTTPPAPLEKGKDITYVEEKSVDTDNQINDTENEEEDSIEATWNAITGGGTRKPKKRQLKKSETWDVPPLNTTAMHRLDSEEILPTTPRWKELRKSETFNDAVSVTRRGGLIRRDPSMTLEEFNQQVEAFIKKFNNDMRLQRQESNKRFLDVVNNRGL